MSSFSIAAEHHDQMYIPAAPISARDLALHLQGESPGQVFAILNQSGFAPRCARLVEGIRDKIHLWMVEILPSDATAETELLVDGQFMRIVSDIV